MEWNVPFLREREKESHCIVQANSRKASERQNKKDILGDLLYNATPKVTLDDTDLSSSQRAFDAVMLLVGSRLGGHHTTHLPQFFFM